MTYHQKHGIPRNENNTVIIIHFKTILCYFFYKEIDRNMLGIKDAFDAKMNTTSQNYKNVPINP